MDLSINVNNITLYIRVAVLIKSQNGYIFEKHKDDYVFVVGGKIQINETSEEAAKRELKEELDFEVNNLKFKSVIENIYQKPTGEKVHEICFVYETEDVFTGPISDLFVEITKDNMNSFDIKPTVMKDFISGFDEKHVVLSK